MPVPEFFHAIVLVSEFVDISPHYGIREMTKLPFARFSQLGLKATIRRNVGDQKI